MMECGNVAIFLVFIFMENQMLSNSWLYSQFPETSGRAPPALDLFLHLEEGPTSVDSLLYIKKQTRVLGFLFTGAVALCGGGKAQPS